MPSSFTCGLGHSWEAESKGAVAHACPVCGSAGVAPGDAPQETVALPPVSTPAPDPEATLRKEPRAEPVVFDSDPEMELPPGLAEPVTTVDSKLHGLAAAAASHRPTIPDYEI